jgi:hypothetical protein
MAWVGGWGRGGACHLSRAALAEQMLDDVYDGMI